MRPRDGTIPLPLAVLLAILLHLAGFAILAPRLADGARASHVRGELAADEIGPPELQRTEELALGIDAETPSSLTWIGYDQYEEHLARLSEIDQAAFDDDPSAGAGGMTDGEAPVAVPPGSAPTDQAASQDAAPEAPATPTVPMTEPREPVEPEKSDTPPEVDPQRDAAAPPPAPSLPLEGAPEQPADQPPDTQTPASPRALPLQRPLPEGTVPPPPSTSDVPFDLPSVIPSHQLLERWTPSSETAPDLGTAPSSDVEGAAPPIEGPTDATSTELDPAAAAVADPAKEASSAAGATETTAQRAPTPPQPAASPETAGSAAPPPAPGPPVNRERADGENADRESDATSRIEVPPDQWRRGKPLAAHGLEIRTRRPVFPELTRLTAAPRSPVVEIEFDHLGVPRRAGIVRTSGDSRVDGPIVDSLYRWRASGAPLAKLRDGKTIRIEMLIVLSER